MGRERIACLPHLNECTKRALFYRFQWWPKRDAYPTRFTSSSLPVMADERASIDAFATSMHLYATPFHSL